MELASKHSMDLAEYSGARKPLRWIIKEVELEKLHKIDIANQSFQATIWVPFVLEGAVKDPELSAEGAVFPFDQDGKPTFKPSAGWYIQQVDFRNALSFRVVDSKVMRKGDDLVMAVRVDGNFTEVFELGDYPFDSQGLTITLNVNTRCNGPMPVEIALHPEARCTMTCIQLCPPNKQYAVAPILHARPHLVGSGDRTFPGISFTAEVVREPFYHLVYLASPFGIFSLLALLTGMTRSIADLNHRAQLALTLVLTASTYRIAIGKDLPPVAYLTTLDIYSLVNVLLIPLIAMEARVQILLTERGIINKAGEGMTGDSDMVCDAVFVVTWLSVQAWMAYTAYSRTHYRSLRDENLRSPDTVVLVDEDMAPGDVRVSQIRRDFALHAGPGFSF